MIRSYVQRFPIGISLDLMTGEVLGFNAGIDDALSKYKKDFLIDFPFCIIDGGSDVLVGDYNVSDKNCPYHDHWKNNKFDFKGLIDSMPVKPLRVETGKTPVYRVFIDSKPQEAVFNRANSPVYASLDYKGKVYLNINSANNYIYREYGITSSRIADLVGMQGEGSWPELPFEKQKIILDYMNNNFCAYISKKPKLTSEGVIINNHVLPFYQLPNKKWILRGPIDEICQALKVDSIYALRDILDPKARGVFPEMETKEILINKIKNILDVL